MGYTVFLSSYVSICNLLLSKYYNRIQCNLLIFILFALSALSSILLYTCYQYTFIIFLCRPLLSLSTIGMWNFVTSMICNFIPNKKRKNISMTLWNSTYPISTFFLVITGFIMQSLSYFDYLLFSAIISIVFGCICLCMLP